MVMMFFGLLLAGPTNLIPALHDFEPNTVLTINSFGLFFIGLAAAALQTNGNIESMVRAQKWAATEYPGQDVTSLIANVQSWAIVFIGFGEGMGQLVGAMVYEQSGFAWQMDVFNICVVFGLGAIILSDRKGAEVEKE